MTPLLWGRWGRMRGIFNFLALVLYLNPVQNGDSAKLPCIFPGFLQGFPLRFRQDTVGKWWRNCRGIPENCRGIPENCRRIFKNCRRIFGICVGKTVVNR